MIKSAPEGMQHFRQDNHVATTSLTTMYIKYPQGLRWDDRAEITAIHMTGDVAASKRQ